MEVEGAPTHKYSTSSSQALCSVDAEVPLASSYDVIVLGLGGLGSSALYWVARQGKAKYARHARLGQQPFRVLGIEQFELGHVRGSSQDHSRIIRLAHDSPQYTKIAPYMYMAWKVVEDEAGIELVHKTGGIVFGPKENQEIEQFAQAMESQGIPFEDLSGEEASRRWPQLVLKPTDRVLYQADAGIVDPRLANAAHISLARAHGAHILDNTKVTQAIPLGPTEGAKVVTTKGTFTCKKLIVAAGAWTNNVLKGFGVDIPIVVLKEQVTYYQTPHLRDFAMNKFPVWISYEGKNNFYGFPVYGEVATKAGVHNGGKRVDPDTRGFEPDLDARNKLEEYLSRVMPTYLGPRLYTKSCLYAKTLDEDLVVSQLPNYPQVSVTIGDGHGYKWASFFGLILSQFALEGRTSFPVEALSVTRPSLGMKVMMKERANL